MGWNFEVEMKRLTLGYIRKEFEKEGYVLLSEKYINSSQKLEYVCPNGHKHSIVWNKWQQKRRCPYCYGDSIGGNIRLSHDYVKKEFEKRQFVLLSKYKQAHKKLRYICNNGHISYITWANFKHNNRGCRVCMYQKLSLDRIGEYNPNWNGGSSCEPYCLIWRDEEYKEYIKERDNYKCLNPDCWRTSKKLTIHHIDYNKKKL